MTVDEVKAIRRETWIATYAAMFASQCQSYRARTSDCASDETLDGFAEEAGSIATEAAERVISVYAMEAKW